MVVEAWQIEEAHRCPRCGTYPWEWDDDPQAYTWGYHVCRGCMEADAGHTALAAERRTAASSPNINRDGWSVRLHTKGADDDDDDDS